MADQDSSISSASGEVAGVRRTVTQTEATPGFWQRLGKRLRPDRQPSLSLSDLVAAQQEAAAAAPVDAAITSTVAPSADIPAATPAAAPVHAEVVMPTRERGSVPLTPAAAAQAAAQKANPPAPRVPQMLGVEKAALEATNARRRALGLPESAAYYMDEPLVQQEHAKLMERVGRAETLEARMAHMNEVGEPAFDFMRQEAAVQPQGIAGKARGWVNSVVNYFRPQPSVTPINTAELGTKWADMAPPTLNLPMDAPHVNAPANPFEVTQRLRNPEWQEPVEWPTSQRLYEAEEARLAAKAAPELPEFLNRPIGDQTLEAGEAAVAARRPGGALRMSAALAAAEPTMRPLDAFGSPDWHGAPLEPAAHRLHLDAPPAEASVPPLRPAAATNASNTAAFTQPAAATVETAEAVETAARPGMFERARSWFAELTTPKTLEQRYPKITALSQSPVEHRHIARAAAEGRIAVDPHLPFAEIAPRADHLGPYKDLWETLADASHGDTLYTDQGHRYVAADMKLADAEQVLANARPIAKTTVIPPVAETPAPTAAELEALGQERLRLPSQSRILSDEPFGPHQPSNGALVVTDAAPAIEEEVVEAAKGNVFTRGWNAAKAKVGGWFSRKEAGESPTAEAAAEAPAAEAAAESHASAEGPAAEATGARTAREAAAEAPHVKAPSMGTVAQEAEKGGRTGLIVAGALATVGGVAWLASSGSHQKREYQRRLDAAAIAPDQAR